MKVYLDLVFFINFFFDLLLLCAVKIVLKRTVKFYRLVLGSLFGGLSIFLLFVKINNIELFAFKILISLIMLLIAFGYKNIRYYFKNFVSLYIISIFLGGFLYLLNVEFSYKQKGIIFFHNGLSINIIFIIILSPVIIYIYIKENKILKTEYRNYFIVKIIDDNQEFVLNGYLDTGNNLVDPITKRVVILVDKKLIAPLIHIHSPIFVPFRALNTKGIIECIKVSEVFVNDKRIDNVLIGLSDEFKMDNIECILNNRMGLI